MEIKQCENYYTSTPKACSTKNNGSERHERKTLRTLQQVVTSESGLEGKNRTLMQKPSSDGKHKTKLYYDEANSQTTPQAVKVYEDQTLPDKWNHVHCTRACQTDRSLLKDLILEELDKQISDPDDSGRVSGFIDQEAHDLMVKEEVSEHYWKDLAEERRRALQETLAENEKLTNEIDRLKEENIKLSEIAAEVENLRELLEGMVSDDEPGETSPKNDPVSIHGENLSANDV
ncbi:hypothetical protein Btru_040955 [Bulinus truncatus]|nr:hypothetical protein Btru_040955 [Bulinus truncatus]